LGRSQRRGTCDACACHRLLARKAQALANVRGNGLGVFVQARRDPQRKARFK